MNRGLVSYNMNKVISDRIFEVFMYWVTLLPGYFAVAEFVPRNLG